MATVSAPPPPALPAMTEVKLNGRRDAVAQPIATTLNWGNSGPLGLLVFAVPTFMLSLVNASAISSGVEPVVFAVALMCGLTGVIAGIIQLRTDNTFTGVLFCGFGAFWLSLFAIAQWFLNSEPPLQVGHAMGLFLYAFGLFVVIMLVASLRTNAFVVVTLALLALTVFCLGAGNYGAHATLIHWGGYLGLAACRADVEPRSRPAIRRRAHAVGRFLVR